MLMILGLKTWKKCISQSHFLMFSLRTGPTISRTDRVSNVEVLNRMGKEMEVLYEVKRRRLEYFGHIIRNGKYRLLQLVVEGKIEGKRRPGQRNTSWLKNLKELVWR